MHLTKDHIELTSASKMRNRLAEQVLDKDMLFLMKSYQATLNDPERLSATIQLLEKTSVLVELFGDTRPIYAIHLISELRTLTRSLSSLVSGTQHP